MPLLDDAFSVVKQENSLRLGALRTYWSSVKLISKEPPAQQPFLYLAGSGLTLVYCYGTLEFCLTRCVQQMAELIESYQVRTKDVCNNLRCLVHDPEIKSLLNAGRSNRTAKRLNLFEQLDSISLAKIHAEFCSSDLQNLWAKSVENVFGVFGITGNLFSSLRSRSRIDRLVNDRNAVAHGRDTPETIGAKYTLGEIDSTIEWLAIETSYFIEKFDAYYVSRQFISSSNRSRYAKRDLRHRRM